MGKKDEEQSGASSESTSQATGTAPRKLTIGRTVHVTDRESGSVHPAIVTHVNEDQSAVATVFKPHETVVGVGFAPAVGNLASPGCWHWPV